MSERNFLIGCALGYAGILMLVIFSALDGEPYKITFSEDYKVVIDKGSCFVLIYGEANRFETCADFKGWR